MTECGCFECIAVIIVLEVEEKTPEDKEVAANREESQQGWQEEKTALEEKGKMA